MKEYYDFVEQHFDGSWWYHGAWEDNNHDTREKAENNFRERLWWDPERPYRILRHRDKFPNTTLVSKDLKVFRGLRGEIIVDGKFKVLKPKRY